MDDTFVNEAPPEPEGALPGLTVVIDGDASEPKLTKDGWLTTELPGGALLIDISGGKSRKKGGSNKHDANLAEFLDTYDLSKIASDLLDGINADLESRKEWIRTRGDGIKHLALKLENPRSPSADADSAVEGQSTVRSPILLDAVMRFQANARGELLPSAGPVKVRNDETSRMKMQEVATDSLQVANSDLDAEDLEKDLNHYLTVIDKPYYPDTNRMFFMQGYGGSGFKKVYRDPILRRPISRAVDAEDLIVSDNEVSLHDCGRVTHRIMMRQSVFRRMELSGHYKQYDGGFAPMAPDPDDAQRAKDDVAGFALDISQRPADYKHTIYECYCELDLPGFEHKDRKGPTGLPLPYRVSIDKDSQHVLEIRRNWREKDENYSARMPFVKYTFVDGLSFYGIGLLNIMGNTTAAVTASWRLALDSAAFASWPGFLYSDAVGRQDTMSFRVPLGGGVKINTNGAPIGDSVMPVPYKDATPGLVQVTQHLEEEARRVGMTPELMVGEGRQDVPVGTTIAMIDQAVKVLDAVHKGMHAAQAEEFELLRELFIEDPKALICGTMTPSRQWEEDELVRLLTNCHLTPQSDPNTPSHTIRVMKAVALVQLVQMDPRQWNIPQVLRRVAAMVGLGSVNELLVPGGPGPQQGEDNSKDLLNYQAKIADIAARSKDAQQKLALEAVKGQMQASIERMKQADRQLDRANQLQVQQMQNEGERIKAISQSLVHPLASGIAQQFGASLPGAGGRVL